MKTHNIFIKNVYYMLSYAFLALDSPEFEFVDQEEFDHIHNLFAAVLARGIAYQLKQGLYREYRNHTDELSGLRGKIDLAGSMRLKAAGEQKLSCEYDELTENNLLNRILKTTVSLLLRHADVVEQYKSELQKEMRYFSGIDEIIPSSIPWQTIRFQRSNRSYRLLISICQLVLEGMLMTTETGEYQLASFFDENQLARLYEKFILEFYRKEFPMLHANDDKISWKLDDREDALLPEMRSDITLSNGNTVLIIDAKCYAHTTQTQYEVHTQHSGNLYQIFTYVKNKDASFEDKTHTVSGLLLYARTDETVQPDMTYHMSGNEISVKTLDLNCPFDGIKKQLCGIAEKYFQLCLD